MPSYDRSSTFDEATGTYRDWGANADGSGYIRERDDGGLMLFDADGPGVIWRIWSALPTDGHMRIYSDGGAEPVFDRPFRDVFDRFGEELSPANFPDLMPTLSRGRNCWIPLAYQQHATIVLDEGLDRLGCLLPHESFHFLLHQSFHFPCRVDGSVVPRQRLPRRCDSAGRGRPRPVAAWPTTSGSLRKRPFGHCAARAGRVGRGRPTALVRCRHRTPRPGVRTRLTVCGGRTESPSPADDPHHLGR